MKNSILILLTFILSTTAMAQNKCTQLFEINWAEIVEKEIQTEMKHYGYSQEGKTLFKKSENGQKIVIGNIKVIHPKHLFEWADQEMHDYWKSNGRYTKSDMDFTLEQPEQALGRGYYVSTDPVDSAGYGTHLTVFKVNEPLFLITDLNSIYYDNPKFLNELRKIGFAGNQGNQNTWLNIFNEKVLAEILPINQKLFDEILLMNYKNNRTFSQKLAYVKFVKHDYENIIKKIESGREEIDDVTALRNHLFIAKSTTLKITQKVFDCLYNSGVDIINAPTLKKYTLSRFKNILYDYLHYSDQVYPLKELNYNNLFISGLKLFQFIQQHNSIKDLKLSQSDYDLIYEVFRSQNALTNLLIKKDINSFTQVKFEVDFARLDRSTVRNIILSNINLIMNSVRRNKIKLNDTTTTWLKDHRHSYNPDLSDENRAFLQKYFPF